MADKSASIFDKEESEDQNPELLKPVEGTNDMKRWLVNYVGEKFQPADNSVTTEMIITAMAEEFPEFLMPIAEENFIRGYRQGLDDAHNGQTLWQDQLAQEAAAAEAKAALSKGSDLQE